MFVGFFYSRSRRGGARKRGFAGGEFRKAAGLRGSSLFTGMRWGGRDFAGRQVFPILWYKGAAACAYYSLKRR